MPDRRNVDYLTQRDIKNGCGFADNFSKFSGIKSIFDSLLNDACLLGSNGQQVIFGSGNGLVPNRRQAITRTNYGPGPLSRTIFPSWFKFDGNVFLCNSIVGCHVTTKFSTCHDISAVVPCVNFHNDHFITTWMRAEWNFHPNRITMENRLWNGPRIIGAHMHLMS